MILSIVIRSLCITTKKELKILFRKIKNYRILRKFVILILNQNISNILSCLNTDNDA